MKLKILIGVIFITVSFSASSFGTIVYKWKDANGVLHFSTVGPDEEDLNYNESKKIKKNHGKYKSNTRPATNSNSNESPKNRKKTANAASPGNTKTR